MGSSGTVRVGISGWRYPALARRLLPARPAPAARARVRRAAADVGRGQRLVLLAAAPRVLPALARRRSLTDFVFAVKGGRFVTHSSGCATSRRRSPTSSPRGCSRSAPASGRCCGSCPSAWRSTRSVLGAFLDLLPADHRCRRRTGGASTTRRCPRTAPSRRPSTTGRCGTPWSSAARRSPTQAAYALLREHDVACVVADTAGRWPQVFEVHRRLRLRAAARRPRALRQRLLRTPRSTSGPERCRAWAADGLDVYVYFDNDIKGCAPHDAVALLERLS